MSVKPRGDGFQADFTHDAKRFRAQFASRREALQWEADAKSAIIAGKPIPVAGRGEAAALTMRELQRLTLEAHWKGQKNERGAEHNSTEAVDYFGPLAHPSEINTRNIAEWKADLAKKGNSPATVNRKLAALSKMLRHAVVLQAIPVVPPVGREKEGKGRTRFLTEAEADKIIVLLNHWALSDAAAFVAFLLDTGARLGEGMRVRPFDLTDTKVTLGALGSKNGEVRHIPLTARQRKNMPELIKGVPDRDPIFGSRLNEWTFRSHFRKAIDHLNLGDDVVIHTLRHTTASWMVQRGVDLRRVKEWMGHKSFEVTLRYAKLAPDDLQAALDRFDQPAAEPNVIPLKRKA